MRIQFLLVCEGSSDDALVYHIEKLLIKCGATEADGVPFHGKPHDTHSRQEVEQSRETLSELAKKVKYGLELFGAPGRLPDLLFVHRDADHYRDTKDAGPGKRYDEIHEAVPSASHSCQYVGVVPVRMTEAWLLVDKCEIRRVAGKPDNRCNLDLPALRGIERIGNPKQCLQELLLQAGSPSGRRRQNFKSKFGSHRRQLIENLPVGGPLEWLPSWVRFRDDTIAALQVLGVHNQDSF